MGAIYENIEKKQCFYFELLFIGITFEYLLYLNSFFEALTSLLMILEGRGDSRPSLTKPHDKMEPFVKITPSVSAAMLKEKGMIRSTQSGIQIAVPGESGSTWKDAGSITQGDKDKIDSAFE